MNNSNIKNYRAGAAIAPFTIVKFGVSSSEVVTSTSPDDMHIGVTGEIGAEKGERIDVRMGEIADVRFGGVIGRGQPLTSDAQGRAVVAAPGGRSVGFAVASGNAGDVAPAMIVSTTPGTSASLDKLLRRMHRAIEGNAYDLPDYGAGPTAGKAAPVLAWAANPPAGRPQYRSGNPADGDIGHSQYSGGVPFANTATSVGFPIVSSTLATYGTSGRSGVAWAVETMTDAAGISIRHQYNPAVQYRLLVDGQFVSRPPAPQTNVNGGVQCLNIDFGSRSAKGRHIRFECELNADFRGFYVGAGDRLWRPTPPDFCRAAWVADSYGGSGTEAGVANSFAHDNYASYTMRLLGIHDANNLCAAGTGFVRGVAQAQNYIGVARVSDLAYLQQKGPVDLVVLQGSINDNGNPAATITANVLLMIAAARASVGVGVPIIVLGVCSGSGGATGPALANELAIVAAVAQVSDPLVAFVPVTTASPAPVISGTGKEGTPVDDGNAQYYIRADGVHPTYGASPPSAGGMEFLARAAAAGIRSALTAMRR